MQHRLDDLLQRSGLTQALAVVVGAVLVEIRILTISTGLPFSYSTLMGLAVGPR